MTNQLYAVLNNIDKLVIIEHEQSIGTIDECKNVIEKLKIKYPGIDYNKAWRIVELIPVIWQSNASD